MKYVQKSFIRERSRDRKRMKNESKINEREMQRYGKRFMPIRRLITLLCMWTWLIRQGIMKNCLLIKFNSMNCFLLLLNFFWILNILRSMSPFPLTFQNNVVTYLYFKLIFALIHLLSNLPFLFTLTDHLITFKTENCSNKYFTKS